MRIPEKTLENIEKELLLRPNGDYEVRVYTLICALSQSRAKHKEETEYLREMLKACIGYIMRTNDTLNGISIEGNEISLRALQYLVNQSKT